MDGFEKEFLEDLENALAKLQDDLDYINNNEVEWIKEQKKFCENRIKKLPERQADKAGNYTPIESSRAKLLELETKPELAVDKEKTKLNDRIDTLEQRINSYGD